MDECQYHVLRACIIVFRRIHTRALQQTATKSLVYMYLHFGKLQSNTFTERIPQISTDYRNDELNPIK